MSVETKKSKKEKRDGNIAYQSIYSSKTSLDASSALSSNIDRNSAIFSETLNTPVNLKKSKTFKLIVKKGGKDKDKVSFGKKDKSKTKNKARKRKEINKDSAEVNCIKELESKRPLFGVSLSSACKHSKSYDGYPVPAFFRFCVNYLEKDNRLSYEGIYRIPGVNSQINKLKSALHDVSIDIPELLTNFETAVIASTIKSFLRDLPTNIVEKPIEKLMFVAWDKFKDNIQDRIYAIRSVIMKQMAVENQYLLSFLISHMTKVIEMSNQNKMTLENLLIVLCPAVKLHFELVKFLYDHSGLIFQYLQVPLYIPPIKPGPQHEEELPETLEGINEELQKQISYLDDLHEQISEGIGTNKTENLIWEVQLIVTSLKRKKYIAELNDREQIRVEIKKYERQLEKLHREMICSTKDEPNLSNSIVTNSIVTSPNSPISTSINSTSSHNPSNQNSLNHPCTTNETNSLKSTLDQELWQVQRTLTTLNRKLKCLTRPTTVEYGDNVNIVSGSINNEGTNDTQFQNDATYDDDNDSVQLNLTLRKLAPEAADSFDNDDNVTDNTQIDVYIPNNDVNHAQLETNEINNGDIQITVPSEKEVIDKSISNESEYKEVGSIENHVGVERASLDLLPESEKKDMKADDGNVENVAVISDDKTITNDVILQDETQDSYINTNKLTDNKEAGEVEEEEEDEGDEGISNSESFRTGSHLATCIDDLIQTGEMWTNENEQLIPEDEDLRNEALRFLYMREELISINNDLKTRLSSESNEINRLKRNIEELGEAKNEKNFHQQHQYQKLMEAPTSKIPNEEASNELEESNDDEEEDEDEENDEEENEEDNNNKDDLEYDELVKGFSKSTSQFPHHHNHNHSLVVESEELQKLHNQQSEIVADNKRLEQDNDELLEQINLERERCLELKVALRSQIMGTTSLNCPSPWPLSCVDE